MLNPCLEDEENDDLHGDANGECEIFAAVDDEVVEVEVEIVEPIEPFWFCDVVVPDDEIGQESAKNTCGDVCTIVVLVRLVNTKDEVDCDDCVHHHIRERSMNALFISIIFVQIRIAVWNHVEQKMGDDTAHECNDRIRRGSTDNGACDCVSCEKHSFQHSL